jgi:hypothetical protein
MSLVRLSPDVGPMSTLVRWLMGGAGWLLAAGFAVWAIGTVGRSGQREADLYKNTVHAFQELNDTIAAVQKRNELLTAKLIVKTKAANVSHETVDSILRAHPVATAPASCAPWTQALSACQAEAMHLRSALTLADSIHRADSTVLARVPQVLDSGVVAIHKAQGKWLGFLPKPKVVLGVGIVSSAVTKPGLALTIGIPIN